MLDSHVFEYSSARRDGEPGNCAKKSHEVSGKPDDDDGFAALAQLESAYKGFASRGRGKKWILLLLDVEEERLDPALTISSSIGSFLINSHRRTSRCNIRITFLLRTA